MAKEKKDGRTQKWRLILWEKCTKSDWRKILSEYFQVRWSASPLHCFDIQDDGAPKPPHWHIVIDFGSLKSLEQVQVIANELHIEGKAQLSLPCNDTQGAIQYFIHLNDKDKYQYKRDEIEDHGMDVDQYFGWKKSEINKAKDQMMQFVIENDMTEFDDLVLSCMNCPLWVHVITDVNTSFFKSWMYSRAMKAKDQRRMEK